MGDVKSRWNILQIDRDESFINYLGINHSNILTKRDENANGKQAWIKIKEETKEENELIQSFWREIKI